MFVFNQCNYLCILAGHNLSDEQVHTHFHKECVGAGLIQTAGPLDQACDAKAIGRKVYKESKSKIVNQV